MKKLCFILICLAFLSSSISCSIFFDEAFYVEYGRVSKSDYDTITASIPEKSYYTFDEVKSIRNKYREKYQYDFSSKADNTEENLYSFLTQKGYTPSEAREQIDIIKNRGNRLLLFGYAYSENYVVWMYIELQ